MEAKYPLITISGPPASGKSTLSSTLSEELDFEVVSGGDIFRSMAAERDMSLAEFSSLCEKDESIDKQVDSRLEVVITDHLKNNRTPNGCGLVVESRLAGWHSDGNSTLSVYLDAPLPVRAKRIQDRDESVEELKRREQSEIDRYKTYYGINVTETSIYDLVLDTNELSTEEMKNTVISQLIEAAAPEQLEEIQTNY